MKRERIRAFRERPNAWVTGPDPVLHVKYRAFIQQRNQAQYRGETWNLDFETWCGIWGDDWIHRGRQRGQKCLTRRNYDLPWDADNAEVVTRAQHNNRQIEQVGRGRNGQWGGDQ